MHKLIRLVKRASGIAPDAFQEHWLGAARANKPCIDGLVRYEQNHTLLGVYARREPAFDGYSEEWFDTAEARDARCAQLAKATHAPTVSGLFDDARTVVLPVEVHVILDRDVPTGAIKSTELIRRRPDLSHAEFTRYWKERHGPLACGIPFLRYEQNHLAAGAENCGLAFDGVATVWFPSTDAMRAIPAMPEHAATRADEANFLDGISPAILARNHVVL